MRAPTRSDSSSPAGLITGLGQGRGRGGRTREISQKRTISRRESTQKLGEEEKRNWNGKLGPRGARASEGRKSDGSRGSSIRGEEARKKRRDIDAGKKKGAKMNLQLRFHPERLHNVGHAIPWKESSG